MVSIGIYCIRTLEILFFVGLAGCSFVVLCSWISIFKSGFSDKDDVKMTDEIAPSSAPSYRFVQTDLSEPNALNRSVPSR